MPTILELAERCEQATGPDRELDALIRCAVFAPAGAFVKQSPINGEWCVYEVGYNGKERSWEPRGLTYEQRTGSFTASLDAAVTLVPEGKYWIVVNAGGVNSPDPIPGRATADVADRDRLDEGCVVEAATPALALCAAALRDRSAIAGEG